MLKKVTMVMGAAAAVTAYVALKNQAKPATTITAVEAPISVGRPHNIPTQKIPSLTATNPATGVSAAKIAEPAAEQIESRKKPQVNNDKAYEQWRQSHQQTVKNLIKDIAPNSVSPYMARQISQDSYFLMNRKKRQGDAQDEDWAYQAASELKAVIYSHPLSSDVVIKSITCKQLMCEFIGVVNNTNSWAPIHSYVKDNVANIQFEHGTRYGDVKYSKDGIDYVYALYRYTL